MRRRRLRCNAWSLLFLLFFVIFTGCLMGGDIMIAIKYLRNEVIDYREFKNTYEFAKWLVDQCKLEDIVIKDIKNIEES